MSKIDLGNLGDFSMLELFREEVETQSAILTHGLVALEQGSDAAGRLAELMRAAHSLKGAARIVGRSMAVRIAHTMEDCLVATQRHGQIPSAKIVDQLLSGVDLLNRIAQLPDEGVSSWEADQEDQLEEFLKSLAALTAAFGDAGVRAPASSGTSSSLKEPKTTSLRHPLESLRATAESIAATKSLNAQDRSLRVTADNLNRLMGLAGESLVANRWINKFAAELLKLKRLQGQVQQGLQSLRDSLEKETQDEQASERFRQVQSGVDNCQRSLAQQLGNLEQFDRRTVNFSTRLYHEVLDCRMRPFADGIQGLHRMVRDVGLSLGKTAHLRVDGDATPVDRDILERLKAPLDHLLRNALDHGLEGPAERQVQGKSSEGLLELQACHNAGVLLVTVTDDGRGIDPEEVRKTVVERKLATLEMTQKMNASELLEFLFLPGFTLKGAVSEISGRGVGLDVVQTMVKEVGGRVRLSSQAGRGTRFQLELPLTLSLVRTMLVEIAGEPFAFPLARLDRALKLPREQAESLQGRQHFTLGEERIGLLSAHQALGLCESATLTPEISIVVLGDKAGRYGLVVDRFLGEQELVVRTLDGRLGKVRNISSAAIMPDGSPTLIIDIDDLLRSVEILISDQQLSKLESETSSEPQKRRKHVLVVDDSLTVRELERKLLSSHGYIVDVAVDGMDGWNAVRSGHFDLVVTDIDMPRLDGIELLKLIRKDTRLKGIPVMIVSYKDRQEDRHRGLEAGADYYLTKASFHDETLLRVVTDLIGDAK